MTTHDKYTQELEERVNKEYSIAASARKNSADFSPTPEIYIAKDVAEKVEGLVEIAGVSKEIRKLSEKYDSELEVAFHLVDYVVSLESGREKAADGAIRAALAFITQGAVAAPLEGIARITIDRNPDNTEYLTIYYAGPIRAAGGTAEALSVIVADYTRKKLGLDRYKPTLKEIGRYAEEIQWYDRHVRLQYTPSQEEVEKIAQNLPVCIDGEPTEDFEVAQYRDLGRVTTNRVRGGMCLVLGEGLAQKAPKLWKRIKPLQEKYGLNWSWLKTLLKEDREENNEETPLHREVGEDTPDSSLIPEEDDIGQKSKKYIHEIPAGRPVFSYPSRKGGFTLRYGRTRATGYATMGLHPATMHLLDDFIAIGTQIRLEYPCKAATITPCDSIDGPVVLLDNGAVLSLNSIEDVEEHKAQVIKILQLGDILISAGEFLENNHNLMPPKYCEGWWALQLKEKLGNPPDNLIEYVERPYKTPSFEEALELSKKHNIPLHPFYTFYWGETSPDTLNALSEAVQKTEIKDKKLLLENTPEVKKALENLCAFHHLEANKIVIESHAPALKFFLTPKINNSNILKHLEETSGIKVMPKAPSRIGARMGRPEKAKPRKMTPAPHVLFPTGARKNRVRNLVKAAGMSTTPEAAVFICPQCSTKDITPKCPACGARMDLIRTCSRCGRSTNAEKCPACGGNIIAYKPQEINMQKRLEDAAKNLGEALPKKLSGVLGMSSRHKIPEALEKGILRAKYNISPFKDGTIRFDSTNVSLTHFKPSEISTSLEKLKKLGYIQDINGEPLKNEEQVIELKPQDIVLSDFKETSALEYFINSAKFVDDLLVKYYKKDPFYKIKKKEDLIGNLVIALAPHTSTGIIGRIIGFTNARVGFAHPAFHAAKRRDCDGDEDAVMLLLGALLNFSKAFLPDKRGGRMDAPLVITSTLDLNEVDDEVFDFDLSWSYPLSFYEAATQKKHPSTINLVTAESKLTSDEQFHKWGFTHTTSDINNAPHLNTYSTGEMLDKLKKQLALAEKIRAVDECDVAERIINTHFLPDIKGNLRTFAKQKVRCTTCNKKYRRPPLSGSCNRCGGNLTFTVHRGGIEKYLEVSKEMIEKYKIRSYLGQQIELLDRSILSIFGVKPQATLDTFK